MLVFDKKLPGWVSREGSLNSDASTLSNSSKFPPQYDHLHHSRGTAEHLHRLVGTTDKAELCSAH